MKLKRLLIIITLFFSTFSISFSAAAPVYAQLSQNSKNAACQGISSTTGGNCDANSASSLNNVIRIALQILSVVIGIIAVVMIIVAGLKFITSGGDAQKAASARNTILYAVVGLIIVALAQVLVRFVLSRAT
jgi:hypothetical protein